MRDTFEADGLTLRKVREYVWEIPKEDGMRVPARVLASEGLLEEIAEDLTLRQLTNTTHLPGITTNAICMPDGHQGYGFPVGGVGATDAETGCISPGAIGYDINCGVRMMTTNLTYDDVTGREEELVNALFANVPSGLGGGGIVETDTDIAALDRARKVLGDDAPTASAAVVAGLIAHQDPGDRTAVAVVSEDRRLRRVGQGLGASVTSSFGVVIRAALSDPSIKPGHVKRIVKRMDGNGLHMTGEWRARAAGDAGGYATVMARRSIADGEPGRAPDGKRATGSPRHPELPVAAVGFTRLATRRGDNGSSPVGDGQSGDRTGTRVRFRIRTSRAPPGPCLRRGGESLDVPVWHSDPVSARGGPARRRRLALDGGNRR
jgi:hypothetical protein